MANIKIFLGALTVAAAVGGISYHFWYSSSGRGWLSACEAEIKNRLKSPSSYSRTEVKLISSKVDAENWVKELRKSYDRGDADVSLPTLAMYERETPEITDWKWLIFYEASNSFGAMVKGASICEARTMTGTSPPKNADPMWVKVDGMNRHERQMELFRDAYKAGAFD